MRKPTVADELDELESALAAKPSKKPSKKRHAPIKPVLEHGITLEQEAYCRARALGMSRKESASMAGVSSGTTCTNWEKNPVIRARIDELCAIATENSVIKNGLDRGWVISRLMTVTERCLQAEPAKDKDGNPTGEFRFDSAGANRSLELLGKTMRMFEGKEKEKEDDFANLSDADLARIAQELAAATGFTALIAGYQEAPGSQQVIEVQAIPAPD